MLTAALVVLLAAAAPELPDDAKKELKALEGDWTLIAIARDGNERELPVDEQIVVTVKGTKFTFDKFGDGEVTALDTTTKPKILDFKMLRKPESGVINEAIFTHDKDTLTVVVFVGDDKNRPTSFDVPKGGNTLRFTLKRVKNPQ